MNRNEYLIPDDDEMGGETPFDGIFEKNKIFSVQQINEFVKGCFDANPFFASVKVRGEISNLSFSNGHAYFSLKDSKAVIRAVMFKSSLQRLKFKLENEQRVVLTGAITLYVQTGSFQIQCSNVEPDGIGALALALEQLKKKLAAEGLFDESIKKPIPKCPKKIGVITSPTGAAIRDIISVTGRRFPLAELIIYPSLVQGDGAEAQLISGIKYFGKGGVDVIIIGRGGGSIEDLWAFNSELLAREIRKSSVPVISAVGHETDFTICDFASDRRAPTPSAAAELAVPETAEMIAKFDNLQKRITSLFEAKIERNRRALNDLSKRRVMSDPKVYVEQRKNSLAILSGELSKCMERSLISNKNAIGKYADMLNALSPLKVLSKGYTAVFDDNKKSIKSTNDVSVGQSINLVLSDGSIEADITKIDRAKTPERKQNDI